jgi:hypothetical protein
VNSGELLNGEDEGMDYPLLPPEAQLERAARWIRDDMDLDILADRHLGHGDWSAVKIDPPIGVDGSCFAKAKDVFRGSVRRRDSKGAKEALAGSEGSLEADLRDLACGRMNPLMVISIDFLTQDRTDLIESDELFPGGCSDDVILDPAVGTLDFSLGLGREGINDVDIEEGHGLFPLRVDVVGFKDGFIPETVALTDEPEHSQGIDIVL